MRIPFAPSRPIRWLASGGALLIVAIVIGTAIAVGHLRERALADSVRQIENTVLLLTRHFDQQFEQLGLVEKGLATQIHAAGIASGEEFHRAMSGRDTHLVLRDKIGALSFINILSLYDAEGTLAIRPTHGRSSPSMSRIASISRSSSRALNWRRS